MIKKSTSSSPKPKVRTTRRKRARSDPAPARHPSSAALALLGRANERVKGQSKDGRHTPVRHGFIERANHPSDVDPPTASLLRASKGGALRLKLYLALLWQAGGGDERHAARWPARAWAELLDLPN